MDTNTLTALGLNETQSIVYIYLVKQGSVSPPEVSDSLSIKRTNAYAVLDQLEELGLAYKKEIKKKFRYFASNPIALEKIARKNRNTAHEQEIKVQSAMPTLLKFFHTFSEQPGVRFYQGIEDIKDVYNDMLRTGEDIYVIRSAHDQDLLSNDFYKKFKLQKAKLGLKTYLVNPVDNTALWNDETDKKFNEIRTQLKPELYTANVEYAVYGNKLSILSFGEEAIGMIIDSPQIATSFRQLYCLIQAGAVHAQN